MVRVLSFRFGFLLAWIASPITAAEDNAGQLQAVLEQNRRLQAQLEKQQLLLEQLGAKVTELTRAGQERDRVIGELQHREGESPAVAAPRSDRDHEIRLSAEVGLEFFRTGSRGSHPNSDFRVDDAKVFLEAPIWKDTYFFTSLELLTREANDEFFHLGPLFVDFENLSSLWGRERQFTLRVGRFDLPFGEEYQARNVMDNPLISHSVADIWGIDEGLEVFGTLKQVSYAIAVVNGGHPTFRDGDPDKSVVIRLGADPTRWLHLSASAMRTGRLSVAGDVTSEVWFGNAFFRALGGSGTTSLFHANLFEGDAEVKWRSGHVKGSYGLANFNDNDPTVRHERQLHYYSVEGMQKIIGGLYGAARWSEVRVARGYPLVGQGDYGRYFYQSAPTSRLYRMSFGLGYQIAPPLLWKAEYNQERGRLITGESRNQEDMIATELAMRF